MPIPSMTDPCTAKSSPKSEVTTTAIPIASGMLFSIILTIRSTFCCLLVLVVFTFISSSNEISKISAKHGRAVESAQP